MKKKILVYGFLPVLAFGLLGSGVAYAQGWGMWQNISSEDMATRQQAMFEQKAEILGVSVDQVKNAWAEGKTIREIANELGLTDEQLQAKMMVARQAQIQNRLQTLVSQGVITQDQANKRLTYTNEQIQNGRGHFGEGLGDGGFHRRFGF